MDNHPVPAALITSKASSFSSQPEDNDDTQQQHGFLERQARRMARWPQTHLWVALLTALLVSALGMYYGDFSVSFESIGWPSRGTLVANRQTQWMLIRNHRKELARPDNEEMWHELTTNVQLGWEIKQDKKKGNGTRRQLLLSHSGEEEMLELWHRKLQEEKNTTTLNITTGHNTRPTGPTPTDIITLVEQCDMAHYTLPDAFGRRKLWPVWKVTDPQASALDPALLETMCLVEEETQVMLHEEGLCFGCDNGQCLPPLSIVLYARFQITNGFALTCQELAQAWAPLQKETQQEWQDCVRHIRADPEDYLQDRGPCSALFSPSMVDTLFETTGRVAYTSSIFITRPNTDKQMYQLSKEFSRGSSQIQVAYDNQKMSFKEFYAKESVPHDAVLVAGSAMITTLAMLFFTRSPFLTLIGILQISLSFPLAFTIYRFVGGITWFPFLNLVGLFVGFALGADHVFVAVDKWKIQRQESSPQSTTEDIAGKALPGAGKAMVLTTITTAIAFFGSSICPVLPIKLFAIFVGLLIVVDYILDCLVMFPCLCIYDGYRNQRNCFMAIRCNTCTANAETESLASSRESEEEKVEEEDEPDCSDCSKPKGEASVQGEASIQEEIIPPDDNHGLTRRILLSFYRVLHSWRWVILAICLAALGVCSYFATTLQVPVSAANIQLLVDDIQYEQVAQWRNELLSSTLLTSGGGAVVVWGANPADTGNHLDPYSWSTLELDETFDPSSPDAQIYMRDYCNNFWEQDFANPETDDICAINRFDQWLQLQSTLPLDDKNQTYSEYCVGASAIPMPPTTFHPCLSAWAQQENDRTILSRDGVVKVVYFRFKSRVRFNSPHTLLNSQWHAIEDWMDKESKDAPVGVASAFFTSSDWWFWDTSNAVYQTAISSGAIAIVVSAVVILISSKSLSMTFFSAISVAYVLVSVTALMSAAGWTLGFLESICFTILIGLSADFVLHFAHAYCELAGDVDRHTRTRHALLHLGPSILAAGFTTLAGAFVMMFTTIHFFRLFALVLFFTIVQATIGSFVFFLVLTECLGPANPTYFADWVMARGASCIRREQGAKAEEEIVDIDT